MNFWRVPAKFRAKVLILLAIPNLGSQGSAKQDLKIPHCANSRFSLSSCANLPLWRKKARMSELSAGASLSHYRIVSKLGAGGMGEVYLAQDTKLDRKVALKILPAELAANQDRMRRFTQEAKAAAALNHPNIATIHEIGESDGVNF